MPEPPIPPSPPDSPAGSDDAIEGATSAGKGLSRKRLPRKRLPRRAMLFYAVGQNAEGIQSAAFHTFLLFYYQQVIGVSGTLAGIALAFAMLADALTDPLAGSMSDRTQTRFGRRHPYIVGSIFPLAIAFVLLFNPPAALTELGSFLWLLVFAVTTRVSLTFYQIPHLALGAELTDSAVRRSSLYNVAALFRMGGEGLVPLIAYVLFFPTTEQHNPGTLNGAGYFWFSIFFAGWMGAVILASAMGTASRIPHLKQVTQHAGKTWYSGYREIIEALGNKSFRTLFFFIFAFGLITSVTGVVSPFMAFHFWGADDRATRSYFIVWPRLPSSQRYWSFPGSPTASTSGRF
ncbi:MAG: MFS transporter [Gammaproteobacteria bacterium]|nr:MFS transporter [Gammaproteobacteria bacterium]